MRDLVIIAGVIALLFIAVKVNDKLKGIPSILPPPPGSLGSHKRPTWAGEVPTYT